MAGNSDTVGSEAYADLATTVGRMNRSAIDAHMADQGFSLQWFNDSSYAVWGFLQPFYSRPGPDGEGGGQATPMSTGEHGGVTEMPSKASDFEEIRQKNRGLWYAWTGVPDGEGHDDPHEATRDSAKALGYADFDESNTSDSSPIYHQINGIGRSLAQLKGGFKYPLASKYESQANEVRMSHGEAALVLKTAYAALKDMWPALRKDVAGLFLAAEAAWAELAKQKAEAQKQVTIEVLGLVSDVVSTAAGLGAATASLKTASKAVSGATSGLSRITSLHDALVDLTSGSYEEIYNGLQESLEDLATGITTQEEALKTMVEELDSEVSSTPAQYDLSKFSVDHPGESKGEIELPVSVTAQLSDQLTAVKDYLDDALTHLKDAFPHFDSRPSAIGEAQVNLSAFGLQRSLQTALSNTVSEYEHGIDRYKKMLEDFENNEIETQDLITYFEADLTEGSQE